MTEVETAWLAGLLEGEGSFITALLSDRIRPRVALSMCDEDVVAKVAAMRDVAYCQTNHYQRNPRWEPAFRITACGAEAVEVVRAVRPFIGTRRIDKAIVSAVSRAPVRKLDATRARTVRQPRFMIHQVRDGLLWKNAA